MVQPGICGKRPPDVAGAAAVSYTHLIADWVKDQYMLFKKNPNYYDPSKAVTEEIKVTVVADDSTLSLIHICDGQEDAGKNADPRRVEQKGTAARNNGAPLGPRMPSSPGTAAWSLSLIHI